MFSDNQASFITAAGTPTDPSGRLDEDGYGAHLRHQLDHGIDGFLICGSMGQMACLTHETWLAAARVAVDQVAGRARILVGIGDNSVERTFQRIDALAELPIDAVVATTPYYFPSGQADLIDYFTQIAERASVPLYLYDLPHATKVKIEMDTMLELARHENIAGAKCSHDPQYVRQLADATDGGSFEVISAQLNLMDMFITGGIVRQLDGLFCLCPQWLAEMKTAHQRGDRQQMTAVQKSVNQLAQRLRAMALFPAFTVAMNLLGFAGRFHPSHMRPIADQDMPRVRQIMVELGLVQNG